MKLYQITIPVAATLYVKAETAEAAAAIARSWKWDAIEVSGDKIDGRPFDAVLGDPDYTAALSPAMTAGGFPMGDSDMEFIEADDMEETE